MGLSLNITIVRGGPSQDPLVFDSETHRTLKIGRLATAQIRLDDPKIARIHAVIELSTTEVSIIDMGSTSGTLVNGAKVAKVKLNHGDQVQVGDTVLAIGIGQALAARPAVAGAVVGPTVGQAARSVAAAAAAVAPAGAVKTGGLGLAAGTGGPVPAVAVGDTPMRRVTSERLRAAAAESRPHPALQPEAPLTLVNRMLELRFYWGDLLMSMNHYVKPKQIIVGEDRAADFFLASDALPTQSFPLLRFRDNEYVLTFAANMEGEVDHGGTTQSLRELVAAGKARPDGELKDTFNLALALDARALLHFGGVTFALRFVAPPVLLKAPFGKQIDQTFIQSFVASLLLHLVLVITLLVTPPDAEALKVDLFGEPDRFASLILEAPKETKSTKDMLEKIKKKVEEKKEEIKPKEEKKPDLMTKTVVPTNMPKPQKTAEQKQQEVAQKFSKLFAGEGGGALLGGGGGGSLSGTLQNVIGTAGVGSAGAGLAGLGIRGTGPMTGGGIGTSRGVGGIGTRGRMGGDGLAYGGVGLGAGKQRSVISLDTPVIEGALAMDVIKKVINENKNQVRYCYENELQRNQSLEGRVLIGWVIGATGAVVQVSIKDTTMKNASVEECLMNKIRAWKFPPPAGGGIVEVKYPFVFKAS